MTKNQNIERFLISRSARIQVHRHGWSSKPNLRPEKSATRRAFRTACRQQLHRLLRQGQYDDFFVDVARLTIDWRRLD